MIIPTTRLILARLRLNDSGCSMTTNAGSKRGDLLFLTGAPGIWSNCILFCKNCRSLGKLCWLRESGFQKMSLRSCDGCGFLRYASRILVQIIACSDPSTTAERFAVSHFSVSGGVSVLFLEARHFQSSCSGIFQNWTFRPMYFWWPSVE